jgi:hypothetical protein
MAWLLAAFALWHFLGVWYAPDACVDFGGSFDYELWECSGEVNKYREISACQLPSFWILVSTIILAVGLRQYARRDAKPAVQADQDASCGPAA